MRPYHNGDQHGNYNLVVFDDRLSPTRRYVELQRILSDLDFFGLDAHFLLEPRQLRVNTITCCKI